MPITDPNTHPYIQRVVAHYRDDMSPSTVDSYSKSPTKPRRFMEYQAKTPVGRFVAAFDGFDPVTPAQLCIAHEASYVEAYLEGHPWGLASSSGIRWTREQRRSVLLTNGSLLSATMAALRAPDTIQLSPTSGFHHATPAGGEGFCTFSGQVIAAVEAWRAQGKRCAWVDLDGHYGNSIEDTRKFCPDLEQAIPPGCNINPGGVHGRYLDELARATAALGTRVLAGDVHYVCVALGADSHEWDQLGGQLTTEEWVAAVDLVFVRVRDWSAHLGRPVPVVLSLFGGYRDDHPESVLGLHTMGVARALAWLSGARELFDWRADVRPR